MPAALLPLHPVQGLAYHGVFVEGVCLAEASNHWHALGSSSSGRLAGWLAQWRQMEAGCRVAWHKRMGPLWCYFNRLKRFRALKEVVRALLRMQPQSS